MTGCIIGRPQTQIDGRHVIALMAATVRDPNFVNVMFFVFVFNLVDVFVVTFSWRDQMSNAFSFQSDHCQKTADHWNGGWEECLARR